MAILGTLLRTLLGKRLPTTEGEVRVAGIDSEVLIQRDRYGIPAISASHERDAVFGLGFCHAQDRASQLEVIQRLGRGTLSEMVGPKAVPVDRLLRTVGFHHAARQQWDLLDQPFQEQLRAYVAGVNQGYQHGWRQQPHEFTILRRSPTPWEPWDVLAWNKLQTWFMPGNWDSELARLMIYCNDGPEALLALDPLAFESTGQTYPAMPLEKLGQMGTVLNDLRTALEELQRWHPPAGGSNNWVIAASRTGTGRPILANDPHLAPVIPPLWYLASIHTPEWKVVGASFAGTPAFPSAHNGHIAWGVTAGLTDQADLMLEKVKQEGDDLFYLRGEEYQKCTKRVETIHVRGKAPVTFHVYETNHGPVVHEVLYEAPMALSLKAVWLQQRPMDGWFSAMKAKSFTEFRESFRRWPGFPQSLVYADKEGNTGWLLTGEVPKRTKDCAGNLPQAAWDSAVDWEPDLVPLEQMPFVFNPKEGYVASANSRPRIEADGAFLGSDFLDSYRHDVITKSLAAKQSINTEDCVEIQRSVECIPWQQIRDIVLANDDPRPGVQEALRILGSWDSHLRADSAAATIYELFMASMCIRVAKAKAPRSWAYAVGKGISPLNSVTFVVYRRFSHLVHLLHTQPTDWFAHSWPKEIADALDEVMTMLHHNYGTNPKQFQWGEIRPLKLKHFMMGPTPLGKVFNPAPIPCGGDEHTPCHASQSVLDPLGEVRSIPNLRTVIDVGNWSNSRFCLAGGQSANRFSPHFDDLLPLWINGESVPIACTAEEIASTTVQTLKLQPQG